MPETFNKDGDKTTSEPTTEPTAQPSEPAAQQTGNEFYLKVGDREFKSKGDVEKHIQNAQTHIANLEGENHDKDTLLQRQTELLEQSKTLEDVMKQVASPSQAGTESATPAPSKDELVRIATEAATTAIQKDRTEEQEKANWNMSLRAAQEVFENPDAAIEKRAQELGHNLDWAVKTAKANPSVFNALFIPERRKAEDPAVNESLLNKGTLNRNASLRQSDSGERKAVNIMDLKFHERKRHIVDQMKAAGIEY